MNCDNTADKQHTKQKKKNNDDRRKISTLNKFWLLMWKNYLLQWRHKTQTLLQILIPVLFIANLVFVRILFEPETQSNNTTYNAFSIDKIPLR